MKRVLLIEDESNLRKLVKLNLDMDGYEVSCAEDGLMAIEMLEKAHYDIVILDLMLPKVSGLEVLSRLRLKQTELPVIITSARDTSSDRILGLKQGADDYLVKPYEIEELQIRMEKLLGRVQTKITGQDIQLFTFGPNTINFETYQASHANEQFELTQKEVLIMKLLVHKLNQVVSREEILRNVWGYDVFPSTRTVDNFISNLRKYFEEDIKQPRYIKSIRGIGYKLVQY